MHCADLVAKKLVFFVFFDFKLNQKRKTIFCFSQPHVILAAFDCIVHTVLFDEHCLISSYILFYLHDINPQIKPIVVYLFLNFCMGPTVEEMLPEGGLECFLIIGHTPVESS